MLKNWNITYYNFIAKFYRNDILEKNTWGLILDINYL